jgi:tetratricopeptide (TPR) repeat protein
VTDDDTIHDPASADTEATPSPGATASPPRLEVVDPSGYGARTPLAEGGMGRIDVAQDRLGRKIAIKELRLPLPALMARFEREALLTARLDHPSIVSVHDAGRWPSGEPFYTMKLVPGRSLEAVIAGAEALSARLALVPHVSAVADALAYAHRHGIIHRDLKPQNVMVGEFGETVVIDWGLAKDLASSAEEPVGETIGAGSETRAGQILGTPAYMPPEQAEGQPADERSDVYAIGAILYHLLAGAPPYEGERILGDVRRGPPPPLAARAPGAPRDLLTIVDRAMARDPGARYPTARQLAEDLRRFQTGQLVGAHRYTLGQLLRRWIRRNRGVVAVAAAATAILLVVSGVALARIVREKRAAEAELAVAEQHRAAAEDLASFMVFDLKDKLEPIGRLELLEAVARKAVDSYTGEPGERHAHVQALQNLGDVFFSEGDEPGAVARYQEALALAASDEDRAALHLAIGQSVRRTDSGNSEQEVREALALYEGLAGRAPADPRWQHGLAEAHYELGRTLNWVKGGAATVLSELDTARTIEEKVLATDPANMTYLSLLSKIHGWIANYFIDIDEDMALAEIGKERALTDQLLAADPQNAGLQYVRADNIRDLGDAQFRTADKSGALASYRQAADILQALLQRDPGNVGWLAALADAHAGIGSVYASTNDPGSTAEYHAGLAIREQILAKDPKNPNYREAIARFHKYLADELRDLDLTQSLAEGRASVAILDELARAQPTDTGYRFALAGARNAVGDTLTEMGDPGGALAQHRAAIELGERLVAADPEDRYARSVLMHGQEDSGDALLKLGDVRGALAMDRAALSTCLAVTAEDPGNLDFQHNLSNDHEGVGDALLQLGDAAGALVEYRASEAIADALYAKSPVTDAWRSDHAVSHENVGDALAALGDAAGAKAEYQTALEAAEQAHLDEDVADVRAKLKKLK